MKEFEPSTAGSHRDPDRRRDDSGGLTPGAHIDWIGVAATLALGLGALAAAAWVLARGTTRAALAWAGIAVVLIASLLPTYSLFTTRHGTDIIALSVIPTLIGLLMSAVMAASGG